MARYYLGRVRNLSDPQKWETPLSVRKKVNKFCYENMINFVRSEKQKRINKHGEINFNSHFVVSEQKTVFQTIRLCCINVINSQLCNILLTFFFYTSQFFFFIALSELFNQEGKCKNKKNF